MLLLAETRISKFFSPLLVLPVGRLAISQFLTFDSSRASSAGVGAPLPRRMARTSFLFRIHPAPRPGIARSPEKPCLTVLRLHREHPAARECVIGQTAASTPSPSKARDKVVGPCAGPADISRRNCLVDSPEIRSSPQEREASSSWQKTTSPPFSRIFPASPTERGLPAFR